MLKKINTPALIMPILVYLIAFGFAELIAVEGNCHGWWDVCWSRTDSGLYLEISKIGHTLYPCGPENGYESGSGKWCGNAGWAPFYPFLIYVFNAISNLPNEICGIILSHVFFVLFLYMAAAIIGIKQFNFNNWLSLFLCALCPGGFYFFSIFPLSLMVLLISVIFYAIVKQKFAVAILPSFLISLTYSASIIFLFSIGIYMTYVFFNLRVKSKIGQLFSEFRNQWKMGQESAQIFKNILLPGIGGLLVLYLYDYLSTGNWKAMYLVQNKYGHLLYSPFKHLGGHYELMMNNFRNAEFWIHFQNVLFFFAIPVFLYFLNKTKLNKRHFIIIYTLIMWYIPYSIGINVSLYRGLSLLAPVMIFSHSFDVKGKLAILALFTILYYKLGILFILSILK